MLTAPVNLFNKHGVFSAEGFRTRVMRDFATL